MFKQILKVFGAGFLGGLFLFILPFLLLKAFLFFLFVGLFFRLFAGKRRRAWRQYQSAQAETQYRKEGLRDDLQRPIIPI